MAQFNLERMQFVATAMMSEENILKASEVTVEAQYSFTAKNLVIAMKTFIWGRQRDERVMKWPVDWWEALKLRFAPFWFTRRWPVRWHTVVITRHDLYPGIVLQGIRPIPFFQLIEYDDGEDDE